MITREHIKIRATPSEIWPLIASPARMREWNSQIISVDFPLGTPVTQGTQFAMTSEWDEKKQLSITEVATSEEPFRVTYRHFPQDGSGKTEHYAEEAYELTWNGQITRLTQTITTPLDNIPWPWRVLIRLVATFGKPTGPSHLLKLKELVEHSAASNVPS